MYKKILLVNDNIEFGNLIKQQLQRAQYQCHHHTSGFKELDCQYQAAFDLLILDIACPDKDGQQICEKLRELGQNCLPIIILSAQNSAIDTVKGIEAGADDYLTKPFNIQELLVRIKAIVRRIDSINEIHENSPIQPNPNNISIDDLIINKSQRTLMRNNVGIHLTEKEFDLLWHFISNPGRVFTRSNLINKIWGYEYEGFDHTVNSHINRLRAKLEINPEHPEYIKTVWGVGYKFNLDTVEVA